VLGIVSVASLAETFVTKSYDKKGKTMYGKKSMSPAMKAKMMEMKAKAKKSAKGKKPMKKGK
jgi:hypothetical protein